MGEKRNAYKILVRPFGKCRRKWEDNIKMVLKETGWQAGELVQGRAQ
jgi:hypothetical protein